MKISFNSALPAEFKLCHAAKILELKLIMKTLINSLSVGLFLFMAHVANGQATTPTDTDSNPRFWQANFTNGGHYMVKLDRVVSVSKHQYISDGVARVTEVTIATDSEVVARFYFLEPVGKDTPISAGAILINRAQDLSQQAAARVSPSAAQLQVVKNYPASTHAHTVEYVLQTAAALESLYGSVVSSVSVGRGRTWKEG